MLIDFITYFRTKLINQHFKTDPEILCRIYQDTVLAKLRDLRKITAQEKLLF